MVRLLEVPHERVWPDIHLGPTQPCHWQTTQARPAGQAIDLGPEPQVTPKGSTPKSSVPPSEEQNLGWKKGGEGPTCCELSSGGRFCARGAIGKYAGGDRKGQTSWPSKGHPTHQPPPWEVHSPETTM